MNYKDYESYLLTYYDLKLDKRYIIKLLQLKKELTQITDVISSMGKGKDYSDYKSRYKTLEANGAKLGVSIGKMLKNPSTLKDEIAGFLIANGMNDTDDIKMFINKEITKVDKLYRSRADDVSEKVRADKKTDEIMSSGSFTFSYPQDATDRLQDKIDNIHKDLLTYTKPK